MARYLVTGGYSFIDSHLVDALVAAGYDVRILDDLSTGKRENVPDMNDVVIGDVSNPDVVAKAMSGIDGCFHLDAIASVQRSNEEWALTHRVNLTGAVNVFDAAIEALNNVHDWNTERVAGAAPVMELEVAVHLGRVQFGNVGAGNRLDFTVIGAAVNEASRIEALSDELSHHLLMSESFAAATNYTGRLVSVGRHRLRGVSRDQELFTVDY